LNTQLLKKNEAPKDTLRPINPDNAWSLRITAAAGYGLFLINHGLYHYAYKKAYLAFYISLKEIYLGIKPQSLRGKLKLVMVVYSENSLQKYFNKLPC